MSAIVVDLKDFAVRTPDQKVRVFFCLYTTEMVKELLWDAFIWHTLHRGEETPSTEAQDNGLSLLFDHLVFLVESIEALRNSGDSDKCVVCGRKGDKAV